MLFVVQEILAFEIIFFLFLYKTCDEENWIYKCKERRYTLWNVADKKRCKSSLKIVCWCNKQKSENENGNKNISFYWWYNSWNQWSIWFFFCLFFFIIINNIIINKHEKKTFSHPKNGGEITITSLATDKTNLIVVHLFQCSSVKTN